MLKETPRSAEGTSDIELLRLTTNIVGCDPDEVTIGMPVEVVFEDAGEDDVFLPLFRPAT